MDYFSKNKIQEEIQAIKSTETEDGWHSDFRTYRPDLFSTYHLLLVSQDRDLFAVSEKTFEEVRSAIKKDFQDCKYKTLSSDDEVALRDYYNSISILDMKIEGVPEIEGIQDRINRFVTPTGLYQFKIPREGSSGDSEGSLIATYYAAILSSKLRDVAIADSTGIRLEEMWQNQSREIESLGRAALVVAILHEIGYSVTDLDRYNNWKYNTIDRINFVLKDKPHLPAPILEHLDLILEYTSIQPSDLDTNIGEKLEEAQLDDGGLNFMQKKAYSEPHGTSVFSSMSSRVDADVDTDSLHSFVQDHRMPSGGYLATVIRHPHFEPTYFALEILSVLEESHHPTEIPPRIMENIEEIISGFESLYKLLSILSDEVSIISPSELRNEIREYILSNNIELSELHYSLLLVNKFKFSLDRDEKETVLGFVQEIHDENGGYGNKPTQKSTYHAVQCLDIIGEKNRIKSDIIPWIRQSRVKSSGYGYLEKNTVVSDPNLLSTYYSTATLDTLDYRWEQKEELKNFILDCRLDVGGFQGEPIESAPENRSLKATYFGIKSLQKVFK